MSAAKPKRVAVVYMLTHPGGVQSCALALIRGLNARAIVPDVLWDQPPSETLLREASAQAGFVPLPFRIASRNIQRLPNNLRYLAWTLNVVKGEIYRDRYDCIFSFYNGFLVPPDMPHLYYLSGPPLLPQLEAASPGLRGVPIRLFRQLYRRGLRRYLPVYEYHWDCKYVINSEYTAGLFHEAHGVALPVVHPAIDLSGRQFAASDLAGRDTLLFFSRIVDYKRPGLVLDLAGRHPQFRCVIMGGVTPNRRAYVDTLKRLSSSMGAKAVFIENPSDQVVREEMARARFYVFPAQGEHFGMTTPEAIASGAVPFVHNSGGQREIVPDARLRFSDADFHQKFAALVSLPEEKLHGLRADLSQHVRQYSSDNFVSKMLQLSGSGIL